jgi:hypothetical protein
VGIGIIGTGMIGETLTRRLAHLGHQAAIANSRGRCGRPAAGTTILRSRRHHCRQLTAARPETADPDTDGVSDPSGQAQDGIARGDRGRSRRGLLRRPSPRPCCMRLIQVVLRDDTGLMPHRRNPAAAPA